MKHQWGVSVYLSPSDLGIMKTNKKKNEVEIEKGTSHHSHRRIKRRNLKKQQRKFLF